MDPDVNEVQPSTEQPVVEEVTETAPGAKTEPSLLLASLHEEREKRRILEAELAAERARSVIAAPEVFSDEGRMLQGQIQSLQEQLAVKDIIAANPALRDKTAEFDAYRQSPENAGMSLQTAAKAFLVEKDLMQSPARKGLEKASGAGRTPVQTGMTAEDIDNLRVNNYNEYARRIRSGTLK